MKSIYYLLFYLGYLQFKLSGTNNKYSYLAFRKLHGLTGGRINKMISTTISKKSAGYKFPEKTNGISGILDDGKLNHIVQTIEKDGFYVFDEKLPSKICDQLIAYSLGIPARTLPEYETAPDLIFDPTQPKAPIYRFKEEDMLKNDILRSILFDTNFLRIAEKYLDCVPLNDIFLMWWSATHSKTPSSRAAQLYHFDMDHPKFLKFFIYVTDVDKDSGPHCYVRGSHKQKPGELSDDRRYEDIEIEKHYPLSDLIEITGKKGTIIAVDTSGIHKGKVPITHERLLIQIEYTNSFFGQKVSTINGKSYLNGSEKDFLKTFNASFRRLN